MGITAPMIIPTVVIPAMIITVVVIVIAVAVVITVSVVIGITAVIAAIIVSAIIAPIVIAGRIASVVVANSSTTGQQNRETEQKQIERSHPHNLNQIRIFSTGVKTPPIQLAICIHELH